MLGAIILIVAAVLAARAVMKSSTTTGSSQSAAAATAFGPPPSAGAAVVAEPAVTQPPEQPATVSANEPAAPVLGPAVASASAAPAATAPAAPTAAATAAAPAAQAAAVAAIGTEIGAVSDLNRLAADQTGVFVFVPSRKADAAPPPKAPMEAAARTISAQGSKIGLFTLKPSSADYEQIAMQVAVPGVMALVKGRGMKAVSGEITETKLVQAFVAASSAGGGCGPASAGCGPSGCK